MCAVLADKQQKLNIAIHNKVLALSYRQVKNILVIIFVLQGVLNSLNVLNCFLQVKLSNDSCAFVSRLLVNRLHFLQCIPYYVFFTLNIYELDLIILLVKVLSRVEVLDRLGYSYLSSIHRHSCLFVLLAFKSE